MTCVESADGQISGLHGTTATAVDIRRLWPLRTYVLHCVVEEPVLTMSMFANFHSMPIMYPGTQRH